MNVIEKILAYHAGKSLVIPGEIIDVNIDYIMVNDACGPLAIDAFEKELGGRQVFNPEKIILVLDHYTPSTSAEAASKHNQIRNFAKKHKIRHFYENSGICHKLMVENHVRPGQLILGADSHTCSYGALGALSTGMGSTDIAVGWITGRTWLKVPETIMVNISGELSAGVYAKDIILYLLGIIGAAGATYKSVCFSGETIAKLNVSERVTLCNMVIEAGGKFSYINPDNTTESYLRDKKRSKYISFEDDPGTVYEQTVNIDAGIIVPQVACPHRVDNVRDIQEIEGVKLDEIFIGGCTNGSYEDLQEAATILENRKVHHDVRLLVTPSSREVYKKAMGTGLLDIFLESGATINHPGCSACFGGAGGILGCRERLLSTANRNFRGRVGAPDSEIYLASPATASASAITGKITDPRSYCHVSA